MEGLTIRSASFSAYSLGNYSTNTTPGALRDQKTWAIELTGIIEAGGADVLEELPLEAKVCFAAVARKERGAPTLIGLVARAEFSFDDDMVSIAGYVVFTPKPFELGVRFFGYLQTFAEIGFAVSAPRFPYNF